MDHLRIEVKPEDGSTDVEYDDAGKVVRIPLSALSGEGARRTKLVLFTCNKCGGRTARLVNPVAWEQGVVFGQCGTCEVWHVLQARNKKIYEEVRYKDEPQAQEQEQAQREEQREEEQAGEEAEAALQGPREEGGRSQGRVPEGGAQQ
ncbi:hypothetical protein GPECTOR_65g190 [Gonium pectorale]|uniref:DNL-type domain-containing protein n=1 Tax=Gonium pectorale TaxID=33097 RepID=A0A150G3X3_GONPE|nr:hypothetical protein GPECTOR_65g190 [Gonium pectorale]|eukprot:KXZ44572.1 hypothetical protein GPECTOR_65g190 [Gonium pectorale]